MAEEKNTKKPGNNPGNNQQDKNNLPKPKFNIYWIYGIIGLAILGTYFLNVGSKSEEISWQRFEKEMLKVL